MSHYLNGTDVLGADAAPSGIVLRKGDYGSDVRNLQNALSLAGFSVGVVDGKFGPATEKAVRAFQKARNLSVDGVAGKDTFAALAIVGPFPAQVVATARTPAELKVAAQRVAADAAAVNVAPAVRASVAQAVAAVEAAKTPAEVAVARQEVVNAEENLRVAASPREMPLNVKVALGVAVGAVALGLGLLITGKRE